MSAPGKPWQNHAALSRPLYAYDLGPSLAESLVPRSYDAIIETAKASAVPVVSEASQSQAQPSETNDGTGGCTLCPGCPSLPSPAHLRAHLRSDWHRYNLALARRGRGKVVDEEQFASQIEGVCFRSRESELLPTLIRHLQSSTRRRRHQARRTTMDERGRQSMSSDSFWPSSRCQEQASL